MVVELDSPRHHRSKIATHWGYFFSRKLLGLKTQQIDLLAEFFIKEGYSAVQLKNLFWMEIKGVLPCWELWDENLSIAIQISSLNMDFEVAVLVEWVLHFQLNQGLSKHRGTNFQMVIMHLWLCVKTQGEPEVTASLPVKNQASCEDSRNDRVDSETVCRFLSILQINCFISKTVEQICLNCKGLRWKWIIDFDVDLL